MQWCLNSFSSVIMCTSHRQLQPLLRLKKWKGDKGDFRISSLSLSSSRILQCSASEDSFALGQRGRGGGVSLSSFARENHCVPPSNVTYRKEKSRILSMLPSTLSAAFCGVLRDSSEDLVVWNQHKHCDALFMHETVCYCTAQMCVCVCLLLEGCCVWFS